MNIEQIEQYHTVTREIIKDIWREELLCPKCNRHTTPVEWSAGGYVGIFCGDCQYHHELISDFINWYFGNGHYGDDK